MSYVCRLSNPDLTSLFCVVRSSRRKRPNGECFPAGDTIQSIVESGFVGFPSAEKREQQLQEQEAAAKPNQTSWTYDIFYVLRQDSEEYEKLVAERTYAELVSQAPHRRPQIEPGAACQAAHSPRPDVLDLSTMRPLVLDCFCGIGGWAEGFLADGWTCLGVDVKRFREYPGTQVVRDVRDMVAADYRGAVDLMVASPVCTEFSKWDNRNLYPDMAEPSLDQVNWCFDFAQQLGCPLVLENVRGLQKLIGPAVQHYGSYYVWGDGVPPLMPHIPGRAGRPKLKWKHRSPTLRAKIPFELAYTVAQFHSARLGCSSLAVTDHLITRIVEVSA